MSRVTITGIADVNRVLAEIAPREARNLLNSTTYEIAKRLAKDGAENVPDGIYKTGQLEGDVGAKRVKGKRNEVRSGVTVAKRSFYWRFLEYGDGPDGVEHAMFRRALQKLGPDLERVYIDIFTSKLMKRITRLSK